MGNKKTSIDSYTHHPGMVNRPLPPLIRHGEDARKKIRESIKTWLRPVETPFLAPVIPSIENVTFYNENNGEWLDLSLIFDEIEEYLNSSTEYAEQSVCQDLLLYIRECDLPSLGENGRVRPRLRFEKCNLVLDRVFGHLELNSIEIVECNLFSKSVAAQWLSHARVHGTFYMSSCHIEPGLDFFFAVFEDRFQIIDCNFIGYGCAFNATQFLGEVSFNRVTFGEGTRFHATTFNHAVHFSDCDFDQGASFEYLCFPKDGWFKGGQLGLGGQFIACYFPTTFDLSSVDLRKSLFYGCTIHQSRAAWTTWSLRNPPETLSAFGQTVKIPKSLRNWVWNSRRVITELMSNRLSWMAVRSLGELHILNRLSLALLFFVPLLAAVWPLVRRIFSSYAEWHGDMPTPFNLPTSLALLFLGAVCVTLGQLVYQIFAPDLVRRQSRHDHIRKQLDDWNEANNSVKWDFLRKSREYLSAVAAADSGRRHPNLVERHRQLVWIPWQPTWFSTKPLPLLDQKLRERELSKKPVTSCNEVDRTISFPTLTKADFLSEEERFRIAVEEGASAEYDLAALDKSPAISATASLYLIGIVIIVYVLFSQVWLVLHEASLLWTLVLVGSTFAISIAWAAWAARRR